MTDEELLRDVIAQRDLMIAVSTGGPLIKEVYRSISIIADGFRMSYSDAACLTRTHMLICGRGTRSRAAATHLTIGRADSSSPNFIKV